MDWKPLLAAAGLDPAAFQGAAPEWNSLAAFDTRAAWTGTWPGARHSLRIEAAAWRGKPVFFALIGPWSRPARMQPNEAEAGQKVSQVLLLGSTLALILGAVFLARSNLKRGRGDRRGALDLAFFTFCSEIVLW